MAMTKASGNEISPAIPSGFPRMKIFMLLGTAYLTLVYILVHLFFPQLVQLLSLPPLAAEFCPDGISGCQRAEFFAFGAACGQALLFCGLVGFVAWHINKAPMRKVPQTPEGRLFGYIEEADWLTAAAVTFQLWDLVISIIIPEHCTAIMIGHHIMAALVAWYGLNNQYFHYYAIFFLGCSEVSGIFLVFLDTAKFYPPIPDTTFDFIVNGLAGPLFAVAFFYYRIVLWWQVSYLMFTDIRHVLNNGMAEKLRPGRNHVLYVMMVLNVSLGLLQVYWSTIILEEVKKLVFGTV